MILNQKLIGGFGKLVEEIETGIPGFGIHSEEDRELKSMFRYPGEMLERFIEKGYDTDADKLSMLCAFVMNMNRFTDEMFVGTQKEDFLNEMRKFREGTKSVYAAAFLYMAGDACTDEIVEYAGNLSDQDYYRAVIEMTRFLYKCDPNASRPASSIDYDKWYNAMYLIFSAKPDAPKRLRGIIPVKKENFRQYIDLLLLAVTMEGSETEKWPELSMWNTLFKALRPLYLTSVTNGSAAEKRLTKFGFTGTEISDLNCGAFEHLSAYERAADRMGELYSPLKETSYIKYMRLLRLWVRTRILSDEDVPDWASDIMFNYMNRIMDRKIDKTDKYTDFLFRSIHEQPENKENAFLLFNLCGLDNDRVNPMYAADHPFGVTYDREFLTRIRDACKINPDKLKLIFSHCIISEWEKNPGNDVFTSAIKETEEFFGLTVKDSARYHDDTGRLDQAVFYLIDTGYTPFSDMPEFMQNFYLRNHYSEKAYEILMDLKESTEEISYADLKNRIPKAADYCENAKDRTDAEKRGIVELELETAFQDRKNYLDLLIDDLKNETVRKLFSEQELMEIYEILSTSNDKDIQRKTDFSNLHAIFLSENAQKERARKKKKAEEDARRLAEKKKQDQIRTQYMDYMKDGKDADSKADALFIRTNGMLPWQDRSGEVFLSVLSDLFRERTTLTLSHKGAAEMLGCVGFLYNLRAVSFEGAKKFIAAFNVKEEKNEE